MEINIFKKKQFKKLMEKLIVITLGVASGFVAGSFINRFLLAGNTQHGGYPENRNLFLGFVIGLMAGSSCVALLEKGQKYQ